MSALRKLNKAVMAVLLLMLATMQGAAASEIDLDIPMLDVPYSFWGYSINGAQILTYGLGICVLGLVFGFYEFFRIKKMPAHESMLKISNLIYDKFSSYNSETGLVELVEYVKISEVNSGSIFAGDLIAGDIYLSMTINGNNTKITKEYLLEELLLDLRANDVLKIEIKRKVSNDEYEILEFSKQILESDFVVVK